MLQTRIRWNDLMFVERRTTCLRKNQDKSLNKMMASTLYSRALNDTATTLIQTIMYDVNNSTRYNTISIIQLNVSAPQDVQATTVNCTYASVFS